MAQEFDDKTLEELTCSSCGLYLSVGPIKTGPSGNTCGRCPLEDNQSENKTFETVFKLYKFPCKYVKYGCTAKQQFGTRVREHEKTCEFKPITCPLNETCPWKGIAVSVFQHCKDAHKENAQESIALNLQYSVDKKIITKAVRGKLCLLHLKYNRDSTDGLSITVRKFPFKEGKELLNYYYDITLRSPDNTNMMRFKKFYNGRYIAKCLLTAVDTKNVQLQLVIPHTASEASVMDDGGKQCGNIGCYRKPLELLTCDRGHNFCLDCCTPFEKCPKCEGGNLDSFFRLNSNYANSDQRKNDVFCCCNTRFGCTFTGFLDDVKIHESTCNLYECLVDNCIWSEDIVKHIQRVHKIIDSSGQITLFANKRIRGSRRENVTHYFVAISACCSTDNHYVYCNESSPRMLVAVRVCNLRSDDTLVKITVNSVNSVDGFSFGKFKVTLGKNITTYENKICPLLSPDMSMNFENDVQVPYELFKKYDTLKICVNDTATFVCRTCRDVLSSNKP